MAITRTQQAKQLLNEIAPKGERLAYINSREAELLKKMGGAGKDINGTGIKSYYYDAAGVEGATSGGSRDSGGYGGGDGSNGGSYDYISPEVQRQSIRDNARIAQEENQRQEEQKKKEIKDIQDAINNPFNKTFVDRGYVPPSTFDPSKAVSKDYIPPEEEEENKFTKALGKTIDIGKNVGKDLLTASLTTPYLGPASFFVGPMVRAAKEDKAKKDAIDAQISDARLSGSFYTGPVNPTTTTRPDVTPDGGSDFPLIRPPYMIQPNIQEVEEEPTPYDFDVYAARDNKIASRFAQGGRTGFNMGGMEEENLQAGAPDLRLEGNQIPQQEEMASAPGIDAELYQLFLDALRKGDVPQGTTFDAYKQLMMQAMSEQQGGQMQQPQMAQQETMQPEMMQEQAMMEPEREMAAYGGIMGSDGRRAYGLGSIFKKAARTVKKVLKSDLGKAALIAAGVYYAPALATRFGGASAPAGSFMKQLSSGNRFAAFKTLMPGGITPGGGAKGTSIFNKLLPKSLGGTKLSKIEQIKKIAVDNNITFDQAAKFVGGGGASSAMSTLASVGIPLAMMGVYKQGKADERPMDENTLARIDQYNNPLFKDGIGGARARIQAGDNTGMSFIGPDSIYAAEGGRIGYDNGGDVMTASYGYDDAMGETYDRFLDEKKNGEIPFDMEFDEFLDLLQDAKQNNLIEQPQMAKEGGLMNLGGNEMDLRGGGFVPLGAKEKADDVPARLSKNEFVFTADAVRAAGGGSVDKGAEKMYNTMKRLEGVMA